MNLFRNRNGVSREFLEEEFAELQFEKKSISLRLKEFSLRVEEHVEEINAVLLYGELDEYSSETMQNVMLQMLYNDWLMKCMVKQLDFETEEQSPCQEVK